MQTEIVLHYGKLVVNHRGEVLITCNDGDTLAIDAGEHKDPRIMVRDSDGDIRIQSGFLVV